jgi:hypothetical protein
LAEITIMTTITEITIIIMKVDAEVMDINMEKNTVTVMRRSTKEKTQIETLM